MFKLYISKASNLLKISAVVILLCIAAGSTAKPAYFSAGSFNLSDSAENQADTAYLNLPVPAQLTDSLVNDSADNTQNKPKAVLGINTQSGAQTVISQPVLGVVKSENSGSNPIETPVQKAAESIVNFSEPLPIKTGNTIKGSLSKKTDSRVYSFTVSQRGYIVLELFHDLPTAPTKAWNAVLFEEYDSTGNGGELKYRALGKVGSVQKDTEIAASEKIGVYPGNYIVVVSAGTSFSPSDFYITAKFTASFDYEAGYNDTISRYNELSLNKPIKGCMNEGTEPDSDWFMFRVDERGFVRISFDHEDLKIPQVGWKISLFDEWGNELYYARSNFSDTTVASGAIGLSEGYYFVNIAQHILSEAEYTLTVRYEQSDMAEIEYNDNIQTATPIELNKLYQGAVSTRSGQVDKDYYKATLPTAGAVKLSFIRIPLKDNSDGWNVKLVNGNGEVLYSAVAKLDTTSLTSPSIGLPAGDYYVVIDSDNRTLNSNLYTIKLDFDNTFTWEAEDNDTRAKANPINVNTEYRGSLVEIGVDFDTDWFSFELKKESRVYVTLGHNTLVPPSNKGWLVVLADKDGKALKSVTSKWGDTLVSTEQVTLPAGKYYVKVDTSDYYNSATYVLKVNAAEVS